MTNVRKFLINDKVKIIKHPKMKCSIWDCWINESENLKIIDNEIIYAVKHDNYRGKMVMFYDVKESDLIKDI